MRLWYQSYTREDLFPAYLGALRGLLDAIRAPGTEIELHGLTRCGGLGQQYAYLEYLEMAEVLDNVRRARESGCDAFLIGHFTDTGLREARELTRMPVLGLCEATLAMAAFAGASVSLVCLSERSRAMVLERVRGHGWAHRLAEAPALALDRPLGLDAAFTDQALAGAAIDRFLDAARASADRGAEVVVAAGGVMMALLQQRGVHEVRPGVPLLSGITALVKTAEAVAGVDRAMGGCFVSQRLAYAPPPAAELEAIRRWYGAGAFPEAGD